jgi:ABC-2 type transport system ATP-binding protein
MNAAARVVDATKRFGSTQALDGLNLEIAAGRVTALLGSNGAGKTTTISMLLGLTSPDSGQVELFGRSPHEVTARQRMGVMLQSAVLPETLRVGELLTLTRAYYPRPAPFDQIAQTAGITDLLHRLYGRLSGGQQRRVQFALSLCGNPDLLCLDEPTVGLDTESRASVWQAIRSRVSDGCAVLLTTHYLEEAEALADRVAVIVRGRVVMTGTVDEVRALSTAGRIRCITTLSTEAVAKWQGVDTVTRAGEYLRLETAVTEKIVQRLFQADPSLSALEVRRGGLAEALSRISAEELQ